MMLTGWRFNVFWNGAGASTSDGADGGGGTGGGGSNVGVNAGPGTGNAGYGDVTGLSVAGVNAPANAATVAAANAATNAANAFGGGQGGIGFGGQTSAGGFGGGPTAAVGGPTGGGGGTATGGSATGPTGGGAAPVGLAGGGIGSPGYNLANAIATMQSYQQGGEVGVPPGYATGVPTATSPVTVSNLAPPSLNPNVVAQLNSLLSGLNAPSLAQLAGTANMGFPAAALVSKPGGGYGSAANTEGNIGTATVGFPTQQTATDMYATAPQAALSDMSLQGLASQLAAKQNQPAETQTQDQAAQPAPAPQQDLNSLMQAIAALFRGQGLSDVARSAWTMA